MTKPKHPHSTSMPAIIMQPHDKLNGWLAQMGVLEQFTANDLESGKTIVSLLRSVVSDSKLTLLEPNTALNRVSNWNNITEELKRINVKVTQDDKNKLVAANHETIFNVISRLRDHHQLLLKSSQLDLTDVDSKKDPKDAVSLLEMLLLLIIRNFGMSPKEAIALLSNDSKYLAHILAKGLKGDFRPIELLLQDCIRLLPKITAFCQADDNQTFFLKSLKPALISKAQHVAAACLQLLTKYVLARDEHFHLLEDHLISTLLLVSKRHPSLQSDVLAAMLIMTEYHPRLLQIIVSHTTSFTTSDLSNILSLLWDVAAREDKIDSLAQMQSMKQYLSQSLTALKQPDHTCSSLHLILTVASIDPNLLFHDSSLNPEELLTMLADVTLIKLAEQTVFLHGCFSLLSITAQSKHKLAPGLFKMLLGAYNRSAEADNTLFTCNFKQIVEDFPSIPVQPILDTLVEKIESSKMPVTQIQLDLFSTILANEGADLKTSLMIYNITSKLLIECPAEAYTVTRMLVGIIKQFKEEEIVIDLTVKLLKVCLAIHFANIKKLTDKRKSITGKGKLDAEQAAAKATNASMELFMRQVLQMKDQQINTTIEPLLCYSYIQLVPFKEHLKGLHTLIALLGDVQQLLSKYEDSAKEDQPDNSSPLRIKNKSMSKVKDKDKDKDNEREVSRYREQETEEEEGVRPVKSISMYPASLSVGGVAVDASKGLEKYQKIYLKKIESLEQEKARKAAEEERSVRLKKLYEKKMIEKGIDIKGYQNPIDDLFEFDSRKDKEDPLTVFEPEFEEDRDVQAFDITIKRYEKVLKLYYTTYAGKKNGYLPQNFVELAEKKNFISTSGLARLFKDNCLDQFISLKEIQRLARHINYKLARSTDDNELLDFEGFKEFVLQAGYTMFTRAPKDLRGRPAITILDQLFGTLQLYASENKISQSLFEDPNAIYSNEAEAVKLLNRKLADNPDYILPEGYKKITDRRVAFDYAVAPNHVGSSHKDVFEIMDQILFQAFQFHLLEPFSREEKVVKARPNLYLQERSKTESVNEMAIPILYKKQLAKYPMKDREIAKEAAVVLADIVQAVELQHTSVGQKHENALIKHKKMREEEEKKLIEESEFKRINHKKELKSIVEQYRETKQTDKSKEAKTKLEEETKKREEKDKREKREKQLKAKIESYNQKKKEEEDKEKIEMKAKLQKEKQEAEKKRVQAEEVKRKIEEIKKKKQEDEKAKKQQQKEEEKRLKDEQKRKFEESQREKKQRVEEYKDKKNGKPTEANKVLDEAEDES